MGWTAGSDQPDQGVEITPEGWLVTDIKEFHLLKDHPPPRPYSYVDQLKEDARSWKPVAFWVVGTVLIGLGAAAQQWLFLPVGVFVLGVWFRMLQKAVDHLRHSPVLRGALEALGPHPLLPDWRTARALLGDGRQIPVVLPARLAGAVGDEHGPVEVLVLDSPQAQYSSVFGIRAIPSCSDGCFVVGSTPRGQ